ncbi:hypothetical protein VP395_08980 [Mariniflexile soesokkakense]|uniref:Uncharacterized protein n=1 Tax=Mariniflexile soesokkakense TaxID=1343160 RepID=A0ABV0A9S5_9FLAO
MADKEKDLIGTILNKVKNHRLIWPIIVFGLIIIGVSKFTNALQDINSFIFPSNKTKPEIQNQVKKQTEKKLIEIINQSESYQIFEKSNPYPIKYNKVKIGTKLSMIKNYYSDTEGSLSEDGNRYFLDTKDNMFKWIVYFFEQNQEDPKVNLITFYAEDNYMAKIKNQALVAFDTINLKSFNLGKILEWSNIEGTKVRIENSAYSISE